MSNHIDIKLIESSIRYGRIYFSSTDCDFFPKDSFGDREGDAGEGKPVEFIAGGETYDTDIRVSSSIRLSPRKSFASFLKLVCAVKGATLRITRISERQYTVDYLG